MKDSKNQIVGLTRELTKRWQSTKERWFDAKTQEFERRYFDLLLPSMNRTIVQMDKLKEMLDQIKRDCEHDEWS